jgi:lycopene beta-cyclase
MFCPLQNWSVTEYTLFSHQLLEKSEYEQEIQNYIQTLINYEIIEKNREHPDELYPFWKKKHQNAFST